MTPIVTRRDLFRLGLAGLAMPGLSRLGFAAAGSPSPRLLVVLNLRGGCDGLNLVSPANDPEFLAARPAEFRVGDEGFPLANGLVPGIDFRLHPAAPHLAELYGAGHLAIVHATGLPVANRSHFVAVDMMDRGVADTAALRQVETGWLARSGRGRGAGPTACVTAGVSTARAFMGGDSVALPDLSGGVLPDGGPQVAAVLAALHRSDSSPVAAAGREALAALAAVDRRLPRDAGGRITPYAPAGKADYAPAGELARPLQTVAQLAKLEAGLATAVLDLGGWDTHDHQQERFHALVTKLSAGLGALWEDLAAMRERVVVVVVSEFGRRLRPNGSHATDHGRGGVALVLGGGVAGGRMAGTWPGLAREQLDEGIDLAVTTDYRQILHDVLAVVDGRPPAPEVFPGFVPGRPLGLFAG